MKKGKIELNLVINTLEIQKALKELELACEKLSKAGVEIREEKPVRKFRWYKIIAVVLAFVFGLLGAARLMKLTSLGEVALGFLVAAGIAATIWLILWLWFKDE